MTRYLIALTVLLSAGIAAAQSAGGPLPADASLEQILDALHAQGQMKDFSADVAMSTSDALTGDTTTLLGTVRFQAKGPGDGRLRVSFDQRRIGQRVDKSSRSEYLLDNGWLIERDYKRKMQIDRQVLKPGQKMNLLKLGEGPFPLPVGQPKEDVLRLFEVKKIEPAGEDPAGTVHLRLTPKPDNKQFVRRFKTIDVWVDTKTAFPRRIEVDDIREKVIRTTDLTNLRLNTGLADADFTLEKVEGWSRRSEALEE